MIKKTIERALEIINAAGYSFDEKMLLPLAQSNYYWECFDDDLVSNGWVIRPVMSRRYGEGFVLDRGPYQGRQYAEELRDLLNEIARKPASQIRTEWEAIEAKRPGGNFSEVVSPLISRTKNLTGRELQLIEVIKELHKTVVSYHVEMGVLLDELALIETARSLADPLESIENLATSWENTEGPYASVYKEFAAQLRTLLPPKEN